MDRVLISLHAPSRKFKILVIPNILAHRKSYEHGFVKNTMVLKFTKSLARTRVTREVVFRSVFRTPSPKFKMLAIPNVLAHGMSYKHGFVKKRDSHKVCTKSRAKSSFDKFFVHHLENSKYWPFAMIGPLEVVRARFPEKSDDHKLCTKSRAKSCFDRIFVHCLRNSKYWPFPMY
ncbi:hypothetical protein B296_00044699 [Ensete ventricosum]|uniref:Uncharacterized protein n=1 Tax=Ensete ventricosum TaxID=4639 RepID=A0A426XJI5_ENSVE|nr:hypothetical protein B296_00044699 [Ensete ventricosum]